MRELVIAPPFTGYEGTDGYVPPEDDEYVIVEVDYGKAELWTAYSYGRDPQMLEDLLSGDYHTVVAADVFAVPIEEVDGDQRNIAKRTSFGILYDVEANTLGKLTKSHPKDAQRRIDRWNNRNKVHHQWAKDIQYQISETGEVQTKTGRKRRIIILGNAVRAAKQAVNYPIQSTSSDVVLDSAIEMHPKLKKIGSHILFTVHDSIVTKCLKSRLQEHCQIMHDAMTARRFSGVVPIPIEVKIGGSWGIVKGVHDCSEEHKDNPYGIDLGGKCLWTWDMSI
jgi:DNA polymerase-1